MSENYLVIVESPTKCSKIQYYLQQINPRASFLVRACCGHFREIQSIHPGTFDIKFQMIRTKAKNNPPFVQQRRRRLTRTRFQAFQGRSGS